MDRRAYLLSTGAAGIAAVAGCLDGVLQNGADGAVLDSPEQDWSDASHPSYGDEVPSFSVEDPLTNETITDEQFRDERAFLMTFIYTSCPDDVCPTLLNYLQFGQRDAVEHGYEDEVAFLPVTFDPETDTAEKLEAEANNVGADLEAENWHFLRPESNDEARELVTEKFGVTYEIHDHETHEGEDEDSYEDGDHENGDDVHYDLVLLSNDNGIVERAYPRAASRSVDEIIDDLRTVVEG